MILGFLPHIVTAYLAVSQPNHTASPFHHLRVVCGKNESRTRSAVEVLHHIKEGNSSGGVQIRRRLVGQN